jgi:tetratricopeptide (TPR) repeat protein
MTNEKALEEANRKAEETIQMLKTKLIATSDRLDTCIKNVNDYSDKISNINKEIINNSVDTKEIEPLKSNLKFYKEMYDEAVKKQDQAIKDIQSLSNTNDPDIVKSDLSELFNNLIDNYREFLSTLSSEQMVIVFNISGYIMLLFTLTSITTLLIGDQLIIFFKVESKYPKLAKYIKLKQTLNKHYLRFYIVLFYILLLLLISINIFMFSLEYFL